MALSERIVVRMSDELYRWIGQQAEREGLDSATWVRSTLTKLKNGVQSKPAAQVVEIQAAETEESVPVAEQIEEQSEPIDIDAMVQQGLAVADAQPQMIEEEQYQEPDVVVRPLFRRPPPFSQANQPGWIKQ